MRPSGYIWTFDNPRGGDYQRPIREFTKIGSVQRHVPKTTLHVDRNIGIRFQDLKAAAARSLDPRKGRGMLVSLKTGAVYVMDNKGNRRGEWVREH